MNIEILKEIGRIRGVDVNTDSQLELIRRMQIKEGSQPCFGTKHFECKETNCLWRRLCQGMVHHIRVETE